jgi:hypothetical protein
LQPGIVHERHRCQVDGDFAVYPGEAVKQLIEITRCRNVVRR